MNKIIQLTLNDLKNITRDDILKYFFIAVPLLFILVLMLVVPVFIKQFPAIAEYSEIIVTFFSLELPLIIGFVISFLMLDEKDERVFTALRVMPVSLFQFLFYRLFFAVFFAFVFTFFMLLLNGLHRISIVEMLLNSLAFALITPILVLIEVSFASNKVTGFTVFKTLNFIFMIPVASFFIESKWITLMGLIPTYWPMQSIYHTLSTELSFAHFTISILYSVSLIVFLSLIFNKRVYNL